MPLTNAGRDFMATDLNNEGVTEFSSANANLGVGDSAAAFVNTQTDLQGTNLRKAMDATFPSRVTNVITARSTFGLAEANFAWNEWGYFNAAAAGTMLNRRVVSLGTKPGTQTWILAVTLTVNNP